MDIGTGLPVWDQVPTSQVCEFGLPFRYDLNASDPSGLDTWWLNDTANFNIGSNGRITSIGVLTLGVFGVQVFVNDTYGNVLIGTFTIIVEDTTFPTWVQLAIGSFIGGAAIVGIGTFMVLRRRKTPP